MTGLSRGGVVRVRSSKRMIRWDGQVFGVVVESGVASSGTSRNEEIE
jgi:hypothetical protein